MCIRQTITNKIISLMEAGVIAGAPRWISPVGQGLPSNAKTGDPYRGINVVLLWAEAAEKGYSSNLWLTYKQAQSMGGQVRKGEASVMCVFFEKIQKKSKSENTDQDSVEFFPMLKVFFLFNAAQIDGLSEVITDTEKGPDFNPIHAADQVIEKTGAVIRHGFDGAFYVPSKDEICLPDRGRFTSTPNFYATAFHELSHWTGHESRLARTFGRRFGDEAYAMEELVAELSAAFTMGHLGMVDGTIENHASYLEHWIQCLKADKTAIFSVASQAAKASDFILFPGMKS